VNVLLLAGDSNSFDRSPTQALLQIEGQYLIDRQIRTLNQCGFNVLVVLNQGNCENILRQSKEIASSELVFDPNPDSDFFSLLISGCHAVSERCFVLPLHTISPSGEAYSRLERHFFTTSNGFRCHLIRPFAPVRGEMVPRFPILVTRQGISLFRYERKFTSIDDRRIVWSPVPILSEEMIGILEIRQQTVSEFLA
jgi:hypothetical protein